MTIFIWWVALTVYMVGYVASVRPLAGRTLDRMIRAEELRDAQFRREYPNMWAAENRKGARTFEATDIGRIRATWLALGKAIFWPIVIPVHLTARTVVSPTERLRASEKENARLRKLAKAEGLDWPEGETT
jgi:hypothetical protein